jgi:hypothetical protein
VSPKIACTRNDVQTQRQLLDFSARARPYESNTYIGVLRDHDERRGTCTNERESGLLAELAAGTSLAELSVKRQAATLLRRLRTNTRRFAEREFVYASRESTSYYSCDDDPGRRFGGRPKPVR